MDCCNPSWIYWGWKSKNQKKEAVIQQQVQLIEAQGKQVEIFEVANEVINEVIKTAEIIQKELIVEEKRIDEAKEDIESTIAIANDIVTQFNALH